MHYRDAFNEAINLFKLKAADLAERSGVGTNQISRFRNGHADIKSETLQKLVDAFPDAARAYFYSRVISTPFHSAQKAA